MHDGDSQFRLPDWIDGDGGRFDDFPTGWSVEWIPEEALSTDARSIRFTVSGTAASYVFGMALDPDLGPDGSDDVVSWDASRGLVLVVDRHEAVGFLLRDGAGRDAIASVQEYGVGRWAPTVPDAAWAAQRVGGAWLVGSPRDVQLVLSAHPTSGARTWRFIVIRGSSVRAVLATADALLSGR
jgi:hypothetical protein